MSDEARAVPVEGDRERLTALLYEKMPDSIDIEDKGRTWASEELADYLLRAGVGLTGSGLREALAEFDGLVSSDPQRGYSKERQRGWDEAVASLRSIIKRRAALSGESGEPNR